MSKFDASLTAIFGKPGPFYYSIVEEIERILTSQKYRFMKNDFYEELLLSGKIAVSEANKIVSRELIDKAHLAACCALFRTNRWVSGMCFAYEQKNFLIWASAARGLIESSGDILDGLLSVAGLLAANHTAIPKALSGRECTSLLAYSEIEHMPDHFVLARWARGPKSVETAKDNAEYVAKLQTTIPEIMNLYRRLCGITHPSSASIDYMYRPITDEGFSIDTEGDVAAIQSVLTQYREAFMNILSYAYNPPLLILRVLHRFGCHPKLSLLNKFNWNSIPAWPIISRELRR